MKSIKQQYIDLKEGRMSQANFMRNLRMTMPQYVTNVTSYGDAVKILRNKGILTESLIKQLAKGIKVEKEHTEDEIKAAEIALDHLKEDDKYYTKLAKAGLEEENGGDDEEAKIAAMIAQAEEEESGKYTKFEDEPGTLSEAKSKWENTSGKSMYAQFKEIDNLNGQEILIGIDYEIEHNHELSKLDAIKLVIKNLKKNPIYYTATLMAGKEMTEIPTIGKLIPGSDKMKELKGEDSLVDKDNGMKPVKDVEKVKASANKAKKETNKTAGTVSLMSLVAKASRGVEKMAATGEKMKVVKEGMEDDGRELSKKIADLGLNKEKWDSMSHNEKLYAVDRNRFIPKGARLQAVKMSWEDLKNNFDGVLQGFAFPTEPEKIKQSGVAKFLTKEDLMEMIREELSEMLSNQQETDDVALGIDETFDGRDNLTDVTGENK